MDLVNVLVLYPTPTMEFLIKSLPQDVSSKYRFILHDQSKKTYCSLQEYLEDAKKIVREQNVEVVLSNNDIGSLVKAALVQEFPHLRGPSVESVFLAYNKYYTHCFLDPEPIPFASIDLTDTQSLNRACEEALKGVGVPAFFKPNSGSGSLAVSSIETAQQLKSFARSYSNSPSFTSECSDTKFMNPFYAKYISERKYPLASKATAILEKHMGKAIKVNCDSYVFNRKIYHWSLADTRYCQSNPQYFFGTFFPTSLPESAQQKIWKLNDAVLERMISFGYDNDFVNIEIFLLESGEVKLIEVNARKGCNLLWSGEVFLNGNIVAAQLKLARGEKPDPVVPIKGRCALYGLIRTCGTGKAREFYDYSQDNPVVFPEERPECVVDGSGEFGIILASALLSGDSYEDVMKKYWSACRQVLLKPELSTWN